MRHIVNSQPELPLLVEDGGYDIGCDGVGHDIRMSDLDAFRCDLHVPSMVDSVRLAIHAGSSFILTI
jgi:hypothetical protein